MNGCEENVCCAAVPLWPSQCSVTAIPNRIPTGRSMNTGLFSPSFYLRVTSDRVSQRLVALSFLVLPMQSSQNLFSGAVVDPEHSNASITVGQADNRTRITLQIANACARPKLTECQRCGTWRPRLMAALVVQGCQ